MIGQQSLPKVSIITVSYNNSGTIEQTIKSVLNQTYSNIEYIIIDGGSTDGTVSIIKKYDKQIAYWISEKDDGISDAFNKGIRKASGDIIGIINSDDWYSENAVELAVKELDKDSTVGFVFGDMLFTDYNGRVLYKKTGNPNYLSTIQYEMSAIPHPTVFVRKEIYNKYGGFSLFLRTAMDYEFLLRISKFGIKGKYIPAELANMRLGGESDINCINGYREVLRTSIFYGYSPWRAYLRFYGKVIKIIGKRAFKKS